MGRGAVAARVFFGTRHGPGRRPGQVEEESVDPPLAGRLRKVEVIGATSLDVVSI